MDWHEDLKVAVHKNDVRFSEVKLSASLRSLRTSSSAVNILQTANRKPPRFYEGKQAVMPGMKSDLGIHRIR